MGQLRSFNLLDIIRRYRTSTFIESGTGWGDGVRHAATFPFEQIISIDIMPTAIERLRGRFNHKPHVRLIAGRSVDVFAELLPQITGNICFWLDAHFPGADMQLAPYDAETDTTVRLPLEQEMRLIKQLRPNNRDVILIDDLRIYERDKFQLGNLDEHGQAHLAAYENSGFLDSLFADTHDAHRSLEQTGYLALMPKPAASPTMPA
ncbi:MAG: hypothetical protein QOF78_3877 [Phycisphaerales bacterium]|nr:hypothetical protein [Phycisphaerales bacterium]